MMVSATTATAVLSLVLSASCQVPKNPGPNQIQHFNSPKCITAASNTNGAAVTISDCEGFSNQVWSFAGGASGAVSLFGGTKCLDVTGGANTNGTPLQIWDCSTNNNANQNWSYNPSTGVLMWTGKGKCLDMTNGSQTNGNRMQIWSCVAGSSNQNWITPSAVLAGAYVPLIAQKVSATASKSQSMKTYPQYTTPGGANGKWVYFSPNTWTSGFLPAMQYLMNTRSQLCPKSTASSFNWVQSGRSLSAGIAPIQFTNTVEHDVGFISFPFQEELVVNPSNTSARQAVINLASELAARYSSIVGCTRSWDTSDPSDFKVIIDNMINLGVLFASNTLQKNQTLVNIAMSHADKTLANHVRADGSSFHLVDYNGNTGAVTKQGTAQGFSDSSTWSRGQSWGILGFATMYQNTNAQRYLDTARRMATYFLNHTPSSGVIPWDFNAPGSPPNPDTSAAMIATNGYLLLSQIEKSVGNSSGSTLWANAATTLFTNTLNFAWQESWDSILMHGTVNNRASPPNNETGTVYGDYYFIKNGNTFVQQGLMSCS